MLYSDVNSADQLTTDTLITVETGAIYLPYKQEVRGSSPRPPTKPPHKKNNIAAWLAYHRGRLRAKAPKNPVDFADPLPSTLRFIPNASYNVTDDWRPIALTQKQRALVDLEDWVRVSRYTWCAVKTRAGYYAAHDNCGKLEYLHRFIMNAQPGEEIDHIDRNGLNCRRGNLRKVTRSENNRNRRSWKRKPRV